MCSKEDVQKIVEARFESQKKPKKEVRNKAFKVLHWKIGHNSLSYASGMSMTFLVRTIKVLLDLSDLRKYLI